jgi:dUTP pyrophosphatase
MLAGHAPGPQGAAPATTPRPLAAGRSVAHIAPRTPHSRPTPPLMAQIVFEPLHDGVTPPMRATEHSAGYDLRAWFAHDTLTVRDGHQEVTRALEGQPGARTLTLQPHERVIIPLGFRATLPPGIEGQIRARSGIALKQGLIVPNAPGTIDPDYTGEWGVLLLNASTAAATIAHGDRVAQLVLARFESLPFCQGDVVQTTSRAGGFGSTDAR